MAAFIFPGDRATSQTSRRGTRPFRLFHETRPPRALCTGLMRRHANGISLFAFLCRR